MPSRPAEGDRESDWYINSFAPGSRGAVPLRPRLPAKENLPPPGAALSPIPRKGRGDGGAGDRPRKSGGAANAANAGAREPPRKGDGRLDARTTLQELRADTRGSEQLHLQLAREVELRRRAEARVEELRASADPLAEAVRLQLEARDAKLEVLQKRLSDMEAERHRRPTGDSPDKPTLQKTADHAMALAAQLQTSLESHRCIAERLGCSGILSAAASPARAEGEELGEGGSPAPKCDVGRRGGESPDAAALQAELAASLERQKALEEEARGVAGALLRGAEALREQALEHCAGNLAVAAVVQSVEEQVQDEVASLQERAEKAEVRASEADQLRQQCQDLELRIRQIEASEGGGSQGSPQRLEARLRAQGAELERATSELEGALRLSSEQQRELERTAEELGEAREHLAAAGSDGELAAARERAAEQAGELERRACELEKAHARAAEQEQELRRAAARLEEVQGQAAEREQRLRDQTQQIEDQAAEIGRQIAEVEELEAKLKLASAEPAEAEAQLREQLRERADRAETALDQLGRELDEKEGLLAEQASRLEVQESELSEKAAELERAEVELDEKEVELDDARRELRDKGGLLSDQAEQIETQAQQLLEGAARAEGAEAELDQVRRELDDKEQVFSDQALQLEEQLAASAQAEEELAAAYEVVEQAGRAEEELAAARGQVAEQARAIEDLAGRLAGAEARGGLASDHELQLREARAQARRFEEAQNAAVASVACLRRESQELGARAARLEAELAKEREEGARQRAEDEAARSEAAAAAAEVASARDSLLGERADLKAKLVASVARLDEEQAERVRQGARAEALEEQLSGETARRQVREAEQQSERLGRRWVLLAEAALPRASGSGPLAAGLLASRAQRRRALLSSSVETRLAVWALRLLEASAQGEIRREAEASLLARSSALAGEAEALRKEAAAAAAAREEAESGRDAAVEEAAALLETKAAEVEVARRAAEDRVASLAEEASEWRRKAEEAERRAADLDGRLGALGACDQEVEEVQERSRELGLTLHQFKEENEHLVVENQSLRDAVKDLGGDLDRVTERHAQLIGHANKNQKIRYTMKLRDECQTLRAELHKARSRMAHLEAVHRSEAVHHVLADTAPACGASVDHRSRRASTVAEPPATPLRSPPGRSVSARSAPAARLSAAAQPPSTPGRVGAAGKRTSPRPQTARGGGPGALAAEGLLQARAEEAERRGRLTERALERTQADLQHMVSLVEKVVVGGEPKAGETTFAELLPRLRSMAMGGHKSANGPAAGSFGSPGKVSLLRISPSPSPGASPEASAPKVPRDALAALIPMLPSPVRASPTLGPSQAAAPS